MFVNCSSETTIVLLQLFRIYYSDTNSSENLKYYLKTVKIQISWGKNYFVQ